ncbi:hypothetical protein [Sphaerotilus mobilis]|uniref:Type IV pilus assembly protein PilW n=1 Tax=Sphaerotilus mobilis TaxID=47994 RepID=A0A4Q7LXI6_9BURK|nr:hypothetical protein [Sphaerotilus mobilis]RZS58719.1 hypothetical protein EV685_1017 [Sphaerotilus mobilis]
MAGGLTLVELLVALAVGLLIVGGAASLLLAQLDQQRQRLADARLTLALHVVADLAVRELRRSGHWGRADDAWPAHDEPDATRPANPHAALLPPAPASSEAVTTTALPAWSYGRASTDHPDLREDHARDHDETGALRLNGSTHAIDLRQSGPQLLPGSGDNWQALSDPQRLRLSSWRVTRRDHVIDLLATCPTTRCPSGDPQCPPQRVIRLLQLDLAGQDPTDPTEPARTRQLSRQVRVRNDELRGHCPP